jgi:hypothetical protein
MLSSASLEIRRMEFKPPARFSRDWPDAAITMS